MRIVSPSITMLLVLMVSLATLVTQPFPAYAGGDSHCINLHLLSEHSQPWDLQSDHQGAKDYRLLQHDPSLSHPQQFTAPLNNGGVLQMATQDGWFIIPPGQSIYTSLNMRYWCGAGVISPTIPPYGTLEWVVMYTMTPGSEHLWMPLYLNDPEFPQPYGYRFQSDQPRLVMAPYQGHLLNQLSNQIVNQGINVNTTYALYQFDLNLIRVQPQRPMPIPAFLPNTGGGPSPAQIPNP